MEHLHVTDEPLPRGVARVVRLIDTERRNALTQGMLGELEATLDALANEPVPNVLVLTHEGSAFCSGTDLAALEAALGDEGSLRHLLGRIVSLFRRVERLEIPTISAIDGAAVGGGFELALACDLRILGPDSWVSLPEVTLGAIPGGGGAHRLPRLIGRARTLELTLTGERLTARQCEDLGLCRPLADTAVLDQALELAARLSAHSGPGMAAIKQLVLDGETVSPDRADDLAVDAMVARLMSADGQEGLSALRERRSVRFQESPPITDGEGDDGFSRT
jgi:enoyl-CoA hydratase/carnithine racemase